MQTFRRKVCIFRKRIFNKNFPNRLKFRGGQYPPNPWPRRHYVELESLTRKWCGGVDPGRWLSGVGLSECACDCVACVGSRVSLVPAWRSWLLVVWVQRSWGGERVRCTGAAGTSTCCRCPSMVVQVTEHLRTAGRWMMQVRVSLRRWLICQSHTINITAQLFLLWDRPERAHCGSYPSARLADLPSVCSYFLLLAEKQKA